MVYIFVVRPNLPQGRVSSCLVGDTYNSVLSDLAALSIEVIAVSRCNDLAFPVSNHADMLFFHRGGKKIFAYYRCINEIAKLRSLGFFVEIIDAPLSNVYPDDVLFNAGFVGDKIICNTQYTHKDIVSLEQCIDVKQGYAKCSTLIVDHNSIITSDSSIYTGAVGNSFNALLIDCGDIQLDGYSYGFIGGCGFKICHDTLYFTGDIYSHRCGKAIVEFINSCGINIICGSSSKLIDVGSILPILEQ